MNASYTTEQANRVGNRLPRVIALDFAVQRNPTMCNHHGNSGGQLAGLPLQYALHGVGNIGVGACD
jgi:hypothetical protein